ncbi:hypothetical protein DFP72DRAFT_841611 [Ephemerocybe angulata]|uniref:HMG box domain-containing protein n=1 Tax=Ephemerocybe angulata TaxID=980116 RepID=A0A8H6MAY5_9AGAR|nr:hypothetical protein DFP72DRAFT_841611 [Tulosesus angulatus]
MPKPTSANSTRSARVRATPLYQVSSISFSVPSNERHEFESGSQDAQTPRPPNLFMLFRSGYNKYVTAYLASQTGEKAVNQRAVTKMIGQLWRSLTPVERQPWKAFGAAVKVEHGLMFPDYVYRPAPERQRMSNADRFAKSALNEKLIEPASSSSYSTSNDNATTLVASESGTPSYASGSTSDESSQSSGQYGDDYFCDPSNLEAAFDFSGLDNSSLPAFGHQLTPQLQNVALGDAATWDFQTFPATGPIPQNNFNLFPFDPASYLPQENFSNVSSGSSGPHFTANGWNGTMDSLAYATLQNNWDFWNLSAPASEFGMPIYSGEPSVSMNMAGNTWKLGHSGVFGDDYISLQFPVLKFPSCLTN